MIREKVEDTVLEVIKNFEFRLDMDKYTKICQIVIIFMYIETHEESLHEKLILNLIYTDSGVCNDPREFTNIIIISLDRVVFPHS